MSEDPKDERKLCELHSAGLMEEVDKRCNNPEFVCGKCRRKANRAEYLHNPLPLKKSVGDKFWS
jgi:hypothetical protein